MLKRTDADLITNKSNIAYLSGFTGSSGFLLICKNKSYLFTDFRYLGRAEKNLRKGIELVDATKMWKNEKLLKTNWQKILKKHKIKKLGIEESDLTISRFKKYRKISPKIHFSDISGKIEEIREIKSGNEIKLIEKSQSINEKVFLVIKKFILSNPKGRFTEKDLAWKIRELANKLGADGPSFDPIIAFGVHSAIPHHESGNTKFKKGDLVLIDMGMKYRGYCSDMTRMIFTAKPTPEQKEIYNLVLKAQENAISKIKAGITGKAADAFARDIISKAGHAENYGHAGGHGLGLDIHEIPSLSENYKKTLRENSVITIEPGIYLRGKFGIRIEDMILVKKSGIKNLTKITKTV